MRDVDSLAKQLKPIMRQRAQCRPLQHSTYSCLETEASVGTPAVLSSLSETESRLLCPGGPRCYCLWKRTYCGLKLITSSSCFKGINGLSVSVTAKQRASSSILSPPAAESCVTFTLPEAGADSDSEPPCHAGTPQSSLLRARLAQLKLPPPSALFKPLVFAYAAKMSRGNLHRDILPSTPRLAHIYAQELITSSPIWTELRTQYGLSHAVCGLFLEMMPQALHRWESLTLDLGGSSPRGGFWDSAYTNLCVANSIFRPHRLGGDNAPRDFAGFGPDLTFDTLRVPCVFHLPSVPAEDLSDSELSAKAKGSVFLPIETHPYFSPTVKISFSSGFRLQQKKPEQAGLHHDPSFSPSSPRVTVPDPDLSNSDGELQHSQVVRAAPWFQGHPYYNDIVVKVTPEVVKYFSACAGGSGNTPHPHASASTASASRLSLYGRLLVIFTVSSDLSDSVRTRRTVNNGKVTSQFEHCIKQHTPFGLVKWYSPERPRSRTKSSYQAACGTLDKPGLDDVKVFGEPEDGDPAAYDIIPLVFISDTAHMVPERPAYEAGAAEAPYEVCVPIESSTARVPISKSSGRQTKKATAPKVRGRTLGGLYAANRCLTTPLHDRDATPSSSQASTRWLLNKFVWLFPSESES